MDRIVFSDNIPNRDPNGNTNPRCDVVLNAPPTDQPRLVDMTTKALEKLQLSEDGFYLMVEGASIDKQMHGMDYDRALAELIEWDEGLS